VFDDDDATLPEPLRARRRPFRQTTIYEAPDWYDVDYAGYRGELAFYRRLLRRHAPPGGGVAVELGAGTGRLAVPFALDGHAIHAVEPAVGMRAQLSRYAAQANVALTIEDASAATFEGPDGAQPSFVYFPFNGLLHLTGRDELRASFAHVRARLAADGRFAFDVTSPYWESMLRGAVPWGRVDERVHSRSGRRFLTCDRARYDGPTRTMHIDIRYAYVEGDDEGVQTALTQRMWTFTELRSALEECGFLIDELAGDVDGAAFDDGSPRLLVCAARR
jgi:hypothetical protein